MGYTPLTFASGEKPSYVKWNLLGANDKSFNDATGIDQYAIANAKVADSAITKAKVAFEYQTWKPTWKNFSPGNAIINARYVQIGKWVQGYLNLTWASNTTVDAVVVELSPPVIPSNNYTDNHPVGVFISGDYGTRITCGKVVFDYDQIPAKFQIRPVQTASPEILSSVDTTVPFTWAVNDTFQFNFMYEAS